ncbi:MAG: 3,4-dihydroxy-2-butanone-4-phosphate synthase, partial [Erysipelotrichaceae bacterium]|nr:3,4-dihydroxy-2-butanone-4-phosphate synthase [Erysipelotrichaceae bacterium]
MTHHSIQEALKEVQAGNPIILLDDDSESSIAHLMLAAEKTTEEKLEQMIQVGSTTLHVSLEATRLIDLGFKASHEDNTYQVVNTVSIEALTADGDSVGEKMKTIATLLDFSSTVEDFRQPGHLFITQAAFGGVLKRAGHIEASIDLAKLAGLKPVGLVSEIARQDGSLIQGEDLAKWGEEQGYKKIVMEDLIAFRRSRESIVKRASSANMPT